MHKYKSCSMWFMALLLAVSMAGCADKAEPVAAAPTPPTVTLTAPARAVTGVPINRKVTATFSEGMGPATITAATFNVIEFGGATIPGSVTLDAANNTATFAPAGNLTPDTSYTATITTGVQNLDGTAMASNYNWSFTTGLTADTTAPTVISTDAYGATGTTSGATGLPVNRNSTATFSESMDPSTICGPANLTAGCPAATFTLVKTTDGTPVAGTVTYSGATATFNPGADLAIDTMYTSTITTGAKDLAGIPIAADYVWSWTTGAPDTLAPTVIATSPADLATNVAIDKKINATFSEEMKQSTIITTNFKVKETQSNNQLLGTVSYDVQHNIATFSPEINLKPDTDYTAMVTNGAKDLAGNALVVPAVNGLPVPNPWTFRTAATPVPPPALAINLRGAATFGIASRAGLTSTGVTVVNGDVALYPLASCTDSTGNAGASQTCLVKTYSSPTGMTVNGSIYWAGDPFDNGGTANSVTNDLSVAWNEGKNKADTQGAVAGNELGGKILTPGVYHNATLGLSAGGIATMDALNDANAVFIFKVDSSFVDSGTLLLQSQIKLLNGAQARNIWFVTGLDITIGSGTTWNGNILAGRTATINNGSAVTGRVLAGASGAGAITLTGAASPSRTSITVPE